MALVAEMPLHAHWSHPLDHWVGCWRPHDQSVLVQVRMLTVDPIAQRLLQATKAGLELQQASFVFLR